jgi:hypothetical protein
VLIIRAFARKVSPDMASADGDNRSTWPDIALCLWSSARRLAPQDLVSRANVRIIRLGRTSKLAVSSARVSSQTRCCDGRDRQRKSQVTFLTAAVTLV